MGNTYLILVGVAPDGCGYLNGEYHQEESEELEDTEDVVRGTQVAATPKGCRTVSMRVTQMNRQEEGDQKAESPRHSGGKCDPLPLNWYLGVLVWSQAFINHHCPHTNATENGETEAAHSFCGVWARRKQFLKEGERTKGPVDSGELGREAGRKQTWPLRKVEINSWHLAA